jgi:hypothetical protein
MSLHFPDDAVCAVPGCGRKLTHQFSVRMRRKDTGADWAPNLPAYFCSFHAGSGCRLRILYEPMNTELVDAELFYTESIGAHRDYPIP